MNRLKELRQRLGLYQKDMAKILKVSNSTYCYWEKGQYEPDNETLLRIAEYFHVTTDYLLGEEASGRNKGRGWIPVYGEIAAGLPISAVTDVLDYEEITPDMAEKGEHIALKVKGESMTPFMLNGDIAILHVQNDVESGEIAAVFVNGDSATLKRVKKTKDGLWLMPINQAYDPMFFTPDEVRDLPVKILGKLVEIRRKV